jgi:hypothetical protein
MANTYAVYNSGKIMLEYWCGDIYFEELLAHQIKQKSDDRLQYILAEIVDFRDAKVYLSDHDVVKVSDRITRNSLIKKVAMVINRCDWDKASLYSRSAWTQDVEVIAFHTIEAACAWVQFDSKHIESKLKQLKAGLLVEFQRD